MENEEIKWDYMIGDKVKYFDPTKSYELTGYRPIDETNGLDFDPDPFMEVVFFKEKYGVHTLAPPKSPSYNEFWSREIDRCKQGLTINGYRITGNHYFFLNFYKLLVADDKGKQSQGRDVFHPSFWSKHYEYFHYIELCQYLNKDACSLKARGVNKSALLLSN